jgi:hypothetical protein
MLARENGQEARCYAYSLTLRSTKVAPIGQALLALLTSGGGELQVVAWPSTPDGVGQQLRFKVSHWRQVFT